MSAPSPRRLLALAAVAAVFGVPVAAAQADDAFYTVWSCRGPDGAPVATSAWQAGAGDEGALDTCASGGSLSAEVTGGGEPGPRTASGWRFMAPVGTVIAGYDIELTASTGKVAGEPRREGPRAGIATGPLVGQPVVVSGCLADGCAFGDPSTPLAPGNLVTSGGLADPSLALVAACPLACGATAASAQLWRSAVRIPGGAPPNLGPETGTLLSAGGLAGTVTIGALASDATGGVARVALRVDGEEVARLTPGGACAEPYTIAAPCPATLPTLFALDTRTLGDGPHTARLTATDAAGQTASGAPLAFAVRNTGGGGGAGEGGAGGASAVPPVPPPATVADARIELDRTRIAVPARGARIAGRVRRADGTPATGAQLDILSRPFGPDAPLRAERSVRAGADGRFAVPAGTTSRRVVVRLRDPGYRSADSAELRVVGPLAVTVDAPGGVLRNGSRLRLIATITGAGQGAAAGRTVLVQALVGDRWATVDSVEAGRDGRASWRYRFRSTTRQITYRFRVRVPRGGADWPWPQTTSADVGVRVRP